MSDELDQPWQDILDGKRQPVEIIYVTKDLEETYLESIKQWGEYYGLYNIHEVRTCAQALELSKRISADVFVLYNCTAKDAQRIANSSPQTPIHMTRLTGYNTFDFSQYPPQVITAGWAAPREHEFMESIADALSKVATEIIYKANQKNLPKIEFIKVVSEELLARLAQFPEERFRLNPRTFEETVAEVLARMGYEVRLTPRTGDKGRDVIASINTPVTPVLMLVECKRYAANRLVGPEPITRLWYRLFDDHANLAMVITTSRFQPVAKETAINRGYQISLKEGEDFIQWLKSLKRK
jgi:HJR/Mrr/RecB family endonuclease